MFTADMIAPCGLDCSLCAYAQIKVNPCAGCNGPDDQKPEFCSKGCGIVLCKKRRENGYRFCDECSDFLCLDVMEKETRYADKYPLTESPIRNIRDIRTMGIEAFLKKEREKWSCRECGGPICVHSGICSGCGKRYGRQPE